MTAPYREGLGTDSRPGSECDRFGHHIGLRNHSPANGAAVVTLRIDERHLNGAGIAHGGVLFSALDQAIAIVANALQPGSVLTSGTLHCLRPARQGEDLQVFVDEVRSGRRISVYEGRILCEGKLIAMMVGQTVQA